MNSSYDETNHRTVLEILRTRLNEGGDKVSHILEGTTARYKLIIDGSEDDSAVRVLFTHGILDRSNTNMFVCSEFTKERHMHVSLKFPLVVYHFLKYCLLFRQTQLLEYAIQQRKGRR